MGRLLDLTGQRFGRLVVIERNVANNKYGQPRWFCRCDCGREKVIVGHRLRTGRTQSCGCLRRDTSAALLSAMSTTHGQARTGHLTSEFMAWDSMRQRCLNAGHPAYKGYGGRGLTVCARWRGSFENFFADMGAKPTPKHSLDRINNDGNYEPDNCRWATKKEQANNRRPRKSKQVAL